MLSIFDGISSVLQVASLHSLLQGTYLAVAGLRIFQLLAYIYNIDLSPGRPKNKILLKLTAGMPDIIMPVTELFKYQLFQYLPGFRIRLENVFQCVVYNIKLLRVPVLLKDVYRKNNK